MYKIKNFETPRQFLDFNEEFIYSNTMQHIFLINVMDQVAKGNLKALQAFNVVGNDDVHLVVFVVDGYCLIYCNKYDSNFLEILSKELSFERLTNFTFAGEKETIENLLTKKALVFTLEKHLTIYKCTKLNKEFKVVPGKMRLATSSELNYLANLNVDFSEEYDGNKITLPEMKIVVDSEIKEKSLQVWENEKICAMAIEMHRSQIGFPEIGQLYVVPHERNKGYSSSLVYKLTEKILEHHPLCMLYTHGENLPANRAFVKVGYLKTGDYARIRINE